MDAGGGAGRCPGEGVQAGDAAGWAAMCAPPPPPLLVLSGHAASFTPNDV